MCNPLWTTSSGQNTCSEVYQGRHETMANQRRGETRINRKNGSIKIEQEAWIIQMQIFEGLEQLNGYFCSPLPTILVYVVLYGL